MQKKSSYSLNPRNKKIFFVTIFLSKATYNQIFEDNYSTPIIQLLLQALLHVVHSMTSQRNHPEY
jgi:hypothetical protein